MSMEGIRRRYGVPAKRGMRVRYHSNRLGTIRSADGHHLMIQLDGDKHTGTYHPTWELEYLAPQGDRSPQGGDCLQAPSQTRAPVAESDAP